MKAISKNWKESEAIDKERKETKNEVLSLSEICTMNNAQDTTNSGTTHVLLYGAIMFANIDYQGILDYTIKAFVGGLFWLGFKVIADRIQRKAKNKENSKNEKK